MDFEEYQRRADQLYSEYLKLTNVKPGEVVSVALPSRVRPHYRRFEVIVDITQSVVDIVAEFELEKNKALCERKQHLAGLMEAFPRKRFCAERPTKADGDKKDPGVVIRSAEEALHVYRLKNEGKKNAEIAKEVFAPGEDEKQEARQVRQYLAHAQRLINAAKAGTFYKAISEPLPKK